MCIEMGKAAKKKVQVEKNIALMQSSENLLGHVTHSERYLTLGKLTLLHVPEGMRTRVCVSSWGEIGFGRRLNKADCQWMGLGCCESRGGGSFSCLFQDGLPVP